MNTYLLTGNYIGAEGNKGLLTEGGSSRKETIDKLAASLGGSVLSLYFSLGESDIIGIAQMPDAASVAALSLAARSTGLVNVKTTTLLSPTEIDAAAGKMPDYRGPGK